MTCSTCGNPGHNRLTCPQPPTFVPGVIEPKPGIPLPSSTDISLPLTIQQIALEVGQLLKKGRMECVYQQAIAHELQRRGIPYTSEEVIPIRYKSISIGFERMDLYLPDANFIIELKATSSDIKPEHLWQLTNYMREKDSRLGILINFNQSLNKGVQFEIIHYNTDQTFWIVNTKDQWLVPMTNYEFTTHT